MARGANVLLLGCGLAISGCVADGVQVRPIADASAKFRYSGGLLEQGRAQLALGNPGIALETFRTLQRQQPESADAFAGIAACYAAMGRYDLARVNYEFALAYAPTDRNLLSALASSLDRLGEQAQATQIRTEIAAMTVAPTIQAKAEQRSVAPMSVPRVGSITVKLPALSPSPTAPVAQAQPAPVTRETPVQRPIVLQYAALSPGNSLSVPVHETPSPSPSIANQEPMPVEKPRELTFAPSEVRLVGGPYLARSSPGEVALITAPGPVWIAQTAPAAAEKRSVPRPVPQQVASNPAQAARALAQATPQPTTEAGLRWLPLKYASARPNIQLLNAARTQNLAARSRAVLVGRGWRKIEIGNARLVRERSLVLYTPARAVIGQRLAAHFRCKAVKVQGPDRVVVLLGRDAARSKAAIARV